MELTGRDDIVAQEDVNGAMSGDLHSGGHIHTGVYQITDRRATEIVGNESLVLIPSCPRLHSQSALNTRLDPLPPRHILASAGAFGWPVAELPT